MARWVKGDLDVPVAVRGYDPDIWGPGVDGVRLWKAAALKFLADNPGRGLPCGDELGVLKEAVRLIREAPQ